MIVVSLLCGPINNSRCKLFNVKYGDVNLAIYGLCQVLLVQCTSYIEKTTRFFQSGCLIDIWYLFALPGSEGMTSNFHVVFPSFISILCLFPESVDFHASQSSALFALFWRHQCQSFISYISWKANKREGCRKNDLFVQ